MWTIKYSGLYIHGYCGRYVNGIFQTSNPDECTVTFSTGGRMGEYKSLHAAKCAVTKYLKAS